MKKSSRPKKPPARKYRQVSPITPAQFIRQHILGMTVTELAGELGRAVAVVSRYDTFPEVHRAAIADLAYRRSRPLLDSWFDSVPFDGTVPRS